jgi:nucleotide-binding universal stress UspA family protein
MKTILAPTDFSGSSLNAVNYAADLACSINAKLVLFHAIHFPIAVSEISVSGDFIDDMLDAGQREMDELLEKLLSRTNGRISIVSEIAIGTVEQEIENISSRERPLVIVLGIRPGKSIERVLMGSSTFHIMNHVHFPTLIIPEGVRYREIKSIGMSCDLRRVNEKLPFEAIKEWLYLFKSKLEIIHFANHNIDSKPEMVSESISIQNRLNTFKPQFHFLEGDNIVDALQKLTATCPLDLLMVFPGKHGILDAFHKSISKTIITHNQFPVLTMYNKK